MAEDDSADRSGDEADRICEQGCDHPVERVAGRFEKHVAEDERGRHPVQEELVPLGDGAGHRGGDDPTKPPRRPSGWRDGRVTGDQACHRRACASAASASRTIAEKSRSPCPSAIIVSSRRATVAVAVESTPCSAAASSARPRCLRINLAADPPVNPWLDGAVSTAPPTGYELRSTQRSPVDTLAISMTGSGAMPRRRARTAASQVLCML